MNFSSVLKILYIFQIVSRKFMDVLQEIYLFNRFGKHVATKNLLTKQYLYNFTYDVDTSFARLVRVTGSGGHRLYLRKIASEVQIETSQSRKAVVKLSPINRMLESFKGPDGAETKFQYDMAGLLECRRNADGSLRFYSFDNYGHALASVSSTGIVRGLEESVYEQQRVSVVKKNGNHIAEFRTTDFEIEEKGALERKIYMLSGGSTFYVNTNGARTQFDSMTHSLLAPHEKTVLKQKMQTFAFADPSRPELTSRLEWRYFLRRNNAKGNDKKSVIKVNGLNILAVVFDRRSNVDSIVNNAGEPLLKIFYNNAGSAIRFQPASINLASMNTSMDSLGRITGYSRGEKAVSFDYDTSGRLIRQSFRSGTENISSRKYTYSSNKLSWPSTVQLPMGSEYRLGYSRDGGLKEVVTPSGEKHVFQFLSEFGFTLSLRYCPYTSKPFLIARNDRKLPVSVVYPNSVAGRRVTFKYRTDRDDTLESVWHDRSILTFDYKKGENYRSKIRLETENGGYEKRFTYQGPLMIENFDKRTKNGDKEAVSGHFAYTFDDLLRVTTIQASFDEKITMEPVQYVYGRGTGRLVRVGNFAVKYVLSKIRLQGDGVFMDKAIDPLGEVSQTSLGVRGRKVCQLFVTRDSLGRMSGITGTVGNDVMEEVKMSYNVDGRLYQMSVGKQKKHQWTVHYDLDGRVTAVNTVKVHMDTGIVRKFGDLVYETDSDGFVVGRGLEKFEYDSFGRIVSAKQDGVYQVRYGYDEIHRLISREHLGGSHLHFFYALLDRPGLITHIYDRVTGTVTVYHYDVHDRLFCIERGGNRYYVQTFPDGSPLHVFGADGELMKSLLRGPFGQVVQDTAPDFLVLVGFRGLFQDWETGLVIDSGRPMDPLIGKWMSVTVDALLAPVNPYFPETFDLLAFDWSKRLTSDLELDAKEWLKLSGVYLDRVVPLLEKSIAASTLSDYSLCPKGQLVSLGIECSLRERIEHFQHFLTSDASKVLPKTPYPDQKALGWSVTPSVYGEGVLVTNYSGMAVTQLFLLASDQLSQDAMLVLLNESSVVPVMDLGGFGSRDKVVARHYFWKPQAEGATKDLALLGIEGGTATLTSHLNLTLSAVSGEEGAKLVEVRSPKAALTVYYGGSLERATEYFADRQLARTSESLWMKEKAAAISGGRTLYQWSDKELEELKENDSVRGYIVRRRMETDSLFLAGDSNFLQFERTLPT